MHGKSSPVYYDEKDHDGLLAGLPKYVVYFNYDVINICVFVVFLFLFNYCSCLKEVCFAQLSFQGLEIEIL